MAYDTLSFESGCPLSQEVNGQNYKIHQLFCRGDQYRVCSEGFLWHSSLPPRQVPFHGDLVLCGDAKSLVARLYSGTLEWVRPIEELSESAKILIHLVEKANSVDR